MVIGPSGGGKTTVLKMVNRLISITEGDTTIDGSGVNGMDPVQLRRGIGYVIQQIGLFPHLHIFDNAGMVPRLLGWDKKRIHARSCELLELVGLDPDDFGKRYPSQLSGNKLLTEEAMQSMNAAVDLDKKDPAEVAKAFLEANKLA